MKKNRKFGGLYLTKRTMRFLKSESRYTGKSVNEIVRFCIVRELKERGFETLDKKKDVKFR